MFIALYEFKVRVGLEEQFEKSWHVLTEAIYKHRGSLGSRLHKAMDGTYIAYAQWPSEAQYNADYTLPEDAVLAGIQMKAACEKLSVLKLMNATDDLLKAKV